MDEQQAIINLKKLFSEYELDLPHTDSLETLHLAISALDKQIPKSPIGGEGFCPTCESCIVVFGMAHCVCCGQAFDWSEKEERC